MPASKEDRYKTTFVAHCGTFSRIRITFGFIKVTDRLSRILALILSMSVSKAFLLYLYDVLIMSLKLEKHIKHVEEVLTVLQNDDFSLNIRKCQIHHNSLDFLGHVLLLCLLSITKDSNFTTDNAKAPQHRTKICSFLGACNVYGCFMRDFS